MSKSPYGVDWKAKDTLETLQAVHDKQLTYVQAAEMLGCSRMAVSFQLGVFRKERGLKSNRGKVPIVRGGRAKRIARAPEPNAPPVPTLTEDIDPALVPLVRKIIEAAQDLAAKVIETTQREVIAENTKLRDDNARLAGQNRELQADKKSLEKEFAAGILTKRNVGVVHSNPRD